MPPPPLSYCQNYRVPKQGTHNTIQSSKMVLSTVNLGPPDLIKSRTFAIRFILGL